MPRLRLKISGNIRKLRKIGPLLTRPPLDRMQQIFQKLKSGRHPNRLYLAREIEVTTKTIQRDIDFMRDRLKLPIAYNKTEGGYEFTEKMENFPMVELSEAELVSVYMAEKALAQYKGTPFEQPLRNAFEKLTSSLAGKITLSWSDMDALVSFKSYENTSVDLNTFQTVSEAVRKGVVLDFEYKKLNSSNFEKRRIEPYHLASIQNQWYCFGHDAKRGDIRTFLLARMRQAKATTITFARPAKFSIKDHLKGAFGVFTAKGNYNIRIRFDKFASQLVRERAWHPSQSIQELTNGELEFRLTLNSLAEIEPWVLSWGSHARVLRPTELIKRLRSVGENYKKMYS